MTDEEKMNQIILTLARRLDLLEQNAKERDRPCSIELKVTKGETMKVYVSGTDPVMDKAVIDTMYTNYTYAKEQAARLGLL